MMHATQSDRPTPYSRVVFSVSFVPYRIGHFSLNDGIQIGGIRTFTDPLMVQRWCSDGAVMAQ